MISKKIMRPNETLTLLATELFGESVLCAYVVSMNYSEKSQIIKTLDSHSKDAELQNLNNKNRIEFDGFNFAVQFTSGKILLFTSSEWSSISEIQDYTIEN